jgi:chromosome segregation ATPase
VPAQIVVLSRHVLLLKKEQQRISSLVLLGSSNAAIRDSELTLSRVKRSFVEYEEYLQQAQYLVGALSSPQSSDGKSAAAQVRELRRLVTSYSGDRSRLEGLVAALEARQAEHRQMLAQMKELSDYMKRLEAEAKSIDALAGSVSSAIWDSKVTLTNASGSLREYEQLLDGAQDVARVLSSPKTLPDEQSDASVIEARSELTSYVNDLPRLRSLVESLEARQSEVQARVNRKRVIAVLMCILLLGLGIGLVRRRWIVRKPG